VSSREVTILVPFMVIAVCWAMARWETRRFHDASEKSFFERNGRALGLTFIALVGFWVVVLVALPYLYMVVESFHPTLRPTDRGGSNDTLTFAQYKSFAKEPTGNGYNTTHMTALAFSLLASVTVTVINLCICYPLAYYMAQVGTPARIRLITLGLVAPYWVNEILRMFSLRLLLATGGLINSLLIAAGIIESPIDFIGMNVGLYVGLSYAYLLVMIFPLYNALESLDKNQIEAARDLGAPWWRIHKDVVIPYAKPGFASGCTMVFMFSAGALAAPQFLGGPHTLWFTSVIYNFFFQAFNWPRGSAYAFILLAVCIALVMLMLRLFKVSLGETTK